MNLSGTDKIGHQGDMRSIPLAGLSLNNAEYSPPGPGHSQENVHFPVGNSGEQWPTLIDSIQIVPGEPSVLEIAWR